MKITIVCGEFPLPSETFIYNQVIELINAGEEVNILCMSNNANGHDEIFIPEVGVAIPISYVIHPASKMKKLKYKLCFLVGLLFKQNRFADLDIKRQYFSYLIRNSSSEIYYSDVFIVHFGVNAVFLNDLYKDGRVFGKKSVFFHGYDLCVKEIINTYKDEYFEVFKNFDFLFPVSDFFRRRLILLGADGNKIHTLHMGIDVDNFSYHKPNYNPRESINLISTARLVEKKGIETALHTCSILKENGVSFQYNILGEGPLFSYLVELSSRLGLSNHVKFKGVCNSKVVNESLLNADLFLLFSQEASNGDMEGIPVSIMEAMARGVPVVTTRHSGIPELVEHESSGFLIGEKDSFEAANLIIDIINRKYDLCAISESAFNRVEKHFNNKKEISKLRNIISGNSQIN